MSDWTVAIVLMIWSIPALAHHSIGMIEISKPVWIEGTVVRYERVNPHVLIVLEARNPDATVRSWTVEGPILMRLERMNLDADFLKAGDLIGVCGFPFKNETGNSHPSLHGHVLVMPDGRMHPWGPYGKLDNCIRAGDSLRSWVDFVNTQPMAHEYWCKRRAFVSASIASSDFIDQINGQLIGPCR